MTDIPIAKRLKEARLAANISQKKLGIAAGIDQFAASARMNQYERGKHIPDYSTLKRVAAVLKVPVTYFYADDELATIIKLYGKLNTADKIKLLQTVKKIANNIQLSC
ncbi:MAG: transcriptional regulator [Gammaproteobacteria bacterium GWE2_37_16]|nr:MAG: transcriptional regulator [Gammaproteobacteria bacterium GWE2_37_16]